MILPEFKIRCSAIGSIMGNVGKPTEKQLAELSRLEGLAKRTAKQEETMKELQARRDAAPSLSAGAKTYCKQWLKEQVDFYNRTISFSSKYTERGIECEPEAIILIGEKMGYESICKNETHYEDEDITGTPDIVQPHIVEDAKASWSYTTFPLFEKEIPDSDYFYQIQGYMELTKRRKGAVNYCLLDMPEHFVMAEAWRQTRKLGSDELEEELFQEVKALHTYSHLPIPLRVKRYEFDKDDSVIAAVRQQVKLCRAYIKELREEIRPTMIINPAPSILIASQIPEGILIQPTN